MVKRKRVVVAVATEDEEGFEPTEEEGSEEFDPEPAGGRKKVNAKSMGLKKKPAVSRKDFIKTENKDGTLITRKPQVNSDYLPIPWKGRLGFACLNTYLRTSNPPIFCSRTCRIETILKQGSPAAGKSYIESLGLANARDLVKMIRWNEKYGIKFLRISSEMFPFASHPKYGYTLEFAEEPLKEAGRIAMEFGHRLTMHPGQFTQIASPKENVVVASVRDLEYHAQLLSLLGLKGQADRDAVMILHMGGVFRDKKGTIDRFRENYNTLLSDDIKARLVLENDDVNYTVHDLLPICKELGIPLVLDYHHHNIRHREDLREGTLDLMPFMDEIKETWTRKNITQKQHYSEPRDDAVTDRDMRKHSKRVRSLPPCPDTMDLMIEAKDKEQAVFGLYKKYGIGGEGLFNEVIPHTRTDENPPEKSLKKGEGEVVAMVKEEDIAMGGEERRVYWPEGNEDWLSPAKKVRSKKEVKGDGGEGAAVDDEDKVVPEKKHAKRQAKKAKGEGDEVIEHGEVEAVVGKKPTKRQTKDKPTAPDGPELDKVVKRPRDKGQKTTAENEEIPTTQQEEVFRQVDAKVVGRRSKRVKGGIEA